MVSNKSKQVSSSELKDRLLDEKEAAKYLGFSPRSLQNWRVRGGGPRFVKVSKRSVRYRISDLVAWVENRTRSSTSYSGFQLSFCPVELTAPQGFLGPEVPWRLGKRHIAVSQPPIRGLALKTRAVSARSAPDLSAFNMKGEI